MAPDVSGDRDGDEAAPPLVSAHEFVPEVDLPEEPDASRGEPAESDDATGTPQARTDEDDSPSSRVSAGKVILRLLLLAVGAFALYGLAPKILDVFAEAPRLKEVNPLWFVAMILCEAGSFACVWRLTRIAVPQIDWFVAGTAQLVSNSVSRVVPGGAPIGAAVGWRMLSVSGVDRAEAGTALASTAFISNGVLFALPLVAVIGSLFGAPVPKNLSVVAWGGALVFVVLFAIGFVLVRFDRPLQAVGRLIERIAAWIYGRINRANPPTAESLIEQRDTVVHTLGSRWEQALAAAVGNWMLDYLALVTALYAVGARPKLSLVLLAYGVAAVLTMIPITPGGLGFVEAGLVATLTLAGIGGEQALLATLAYRIASYWVPLPAGLVAWILFKRRYGNPPDTDDAEHPDLAPA